MSNTEIINIEVDANKALQAISEANAAIKELTDANKQLAAEMEADTSKRQRIQTLSRSITPRYEY